MRIRGNNFDEFSPGISTFLPDYPLFSRVTGNVPSFCISVYFSPGIFSWHPISGCGFRSTFLSEIGRNAGICPFLTVTPRFFFDGARRRCPEAMRSVKPAKRLVQKGDGKKSGMPQRLTRHRGLQQQLTAAGPIPGLRRAGGMCQEKWLIYNKIRQHLSPNINNSPGKRARIILENQELSWIFTTGFILECHELSRKQSKIYPGNARIILEFTTRFILDSKNYPSK